MPREVEVSLPPSREAPAVRGEGEWLALAAAKLRVPASTLAHTRVARVSFDARARYRVWRVLLRVYAPGEAVPAPPATTPPTYASPSPGARHVVVVGSGPAGLFCALDCLAAGLRVTVFERGKDVRARRQSLQLVNRGTDVDRDSNYCFGEGGAGTYSDGKLYTRMGSKREVAEVLAQLVAHGAPVEILTHWRPHVGSNRLPGVVQAMRETILRSGGIVRFRSRAEQLDVDLVGGVRRVRGVVVRDLETHQVASTACDAVVLATGHSALDSVAMASRAGARLEAKGFAMGVRAEHAQAWLDDRQYGGMRGECELPASFYELASQQEGGRGVYSFCMCPGGLIVPATTAPERVVVNGMSLSRRDSRFANSGVVVQIEPDDWCAGQGDAWGFRELLARALSLGVDLGGLTAAELPRTAAEDALFGVRMQLALEAVASSLAGGHGRAPVQRADLVADGSRATASALPTSFHPGLTPVDLGAVLPRGILSRLRPALAEFDRKLPGFAGEHGQLVGVESRTSSPVRIVRDRETLQSPTVAGLYPCGEGAGYAGGIVSAALDGRRVAGAVTASA